MKKHLLLILFLIPGFLFAQWDVVSFSKSGGVYERPFMLTLQCNNTTHSIYYTLNGSTPTASSHLYTQPLLVNHLLYSSSEYYKLRTIPPDEELYVPDSIFRSVVIRAAVFDNAGNRISPIVTNSYFIKSMGCDFHGLPVISLCADSLDLYSEETGIMVPGANLVPSDAHWTGNYYMTGREWERLCNVEYYDNDNSGFNQQAGVRTHGGNGRRFDQKGLKIYAREEYGKKRFSYKIFDNLNINSFKRLVLKPFKCAWTEAGLQDHLSSLIAQNLQVDILASQPVVLFLNGEYWGLYFIHEKADERYVEDHYNVDHDFCNIMGSWLPSIVAGESTYFIQLMDWLETADLSDSIQYQYISEKIDIENFIDYQIMEMFISNTDWPANNMRCWQEPGGPWRWIFYDGDAGFQNYHANVFANAVSESTQEWPTNARSTLLFRRLLQNKTFCKQFVQRYNELSNHYLAYQYTGNYLLQTQNQIKNEIPRQSFRFGNPTNINEWKQAVKAVDKFLQKRTQAMTDSLKVFFNLPDDPENLSETIIFPNPASDHFSILFHAEEFGIQKVTIKDMLGRVCYANEILYNEGENTIPIQCNLRSGTYIVTLGKTSKKLVIAR